MDLKTASFVVPLLREERQVMDLSNSLLAITGIGAIRMDLPSHTVTVDYDPTYVGAAMMRGCIAGSGYPLADVS